MHKRLPLSEQKKKRGTIVLFSNRLAAADVSACARIDDQFIAFIDE